MNLTELLLPLRGDRLLLGLFPLPRNSFRDGTFDDFKLAAGPALLVLLFPTLGVLRNPTVLDYAVDLVVVAVPVVVCYCDGSQF